MLTNTSQHTYVIGLPGNLDTLRGNLSNNPDGDTGAREGVAHDEVLRDTELSAEFPHLILEKLP